MHSSAQYPGSSAVTGQPDIDERLHLLLDALEGIGLEVAVVNWRPRGRRPNGGLLGAPGIAP
jgi:hypothetical protein